MKESKNELYYKNYNVITKRMDHLYNIAYTMYLENIISYNMMDDIKIKVKKVKNVIQERINKIKYRHKTSELICDDETYQYISQIEMNILESISSKITELNEKRSKSRVHIWLTKLFNRLK